MGNFGKSNFENSQKKYATFPVRLLFYKLYLLLLATKQKRKCLPMGYFSKSVALYVIQLAICWWQNFDQLYAIADQRTKETKRLIEDWVVNSELASHTW